MNLELLKGSPNKDFARDLYNISFPDNQKREFNLIENLTEKDYFDFFIILHPSVNNKPIGIISLWHFSEYIFIEHFAIDIKHRSKGYGSKILQELIDKIKMPIILEVESFSDADSKRRIRFYEDLNFKLLNQPYFQPPYIIGQNPIDMNLMLYNIGLLDKKPLKDIIKEIHSVVYGYEL